MTETVCPQRGMAWRALRKRDSLSMGSKTGAGPPCGGDDAELSRTEKKEREDSDSVRGNSICKGRKQHHNAGNNNEQFVFMLTGWQGMRLVMKAGLWRVSKAWALSFHGTTNFLECIALIHRLTPNVSSSKESPLTSPELRTFLFIHFE